MCGGCEIEVFSVRGWQWPTDGSTPQAGRMSIREKDQCTMNWANVPARAASLSRLSNIPC